MSHKLAEELLTPTNHELFALVKARIDAGYAMTLIAGEIGIHVDDLCDWILNVYREPRKRKHKAYSTRHMAAIGFSDPADRHWSAGQNAQRFATWRRAKMAATRALDGVK